MGQQRILPEVSASELAGKGKRLHAWSTAAARGSKWQGEMEVYGIVLLIRWEWASGLLTLCRHGWFLYRIKVCLIKII